MKKIVQDGVSVLRDIALPVPEKMFGSPELTRIISDMTESLAPEHDGVALAAPQIAFSYRIFIVRMDRVVTPLTANGELIEPLVNVYINPEIIKTSRKTADREEGCLSVRGVYGIAKRHERVTVKARNQDGSTFTRGGGGLLAQIFEHEIDHLNGVLFTDHAEGLVKITHNKEHEKE